MRTLRTAHNAWRAYVDFNAIFAINMTFKYNTRQFIKEMQCRPCLWNVNITEYNDRGAREMAWLEIAQIMYDDWDDLDLDDKTEKVKDLQKKWKGLRDYHTRVQNKKYTPKNAPELQLQRGRKRPFLDMLNFLNAKKKTNQTPQNQQLPESNPGQAIIKPSNATVTSYKQAKQGSAATRTAAPQPPALLQPSPTQETTERPTNDPDANFLFSILPDMKSMNPTQNFEFRFQVMKLIKDLKYNQHNSDYYVYCAPGSSTFTTHVPKYKNTAIPEQNIEIDPISNESAVSSPEDIKVILHDSE